MKAYNVYRWDKWVSSHTSRIGAERDVLTRSGASVIEAIKYQGYEIKHGSAPKGKGLIKRG